MEPLIRDLLVRRRERTVTVTAPIGRDGVEAGEFPGDLDIEAMARGLTALLDGLVLSAWRKGLVSTAGDGATCACLPGSRRSARCR